MPARMSLFTIRRMVLNQGMTKGSHFAEEIGIEILAAERSLRAVNRRLQQSLIADTGASPATLRYFLVKIENLFGVKISHALAKRLRSS
jgi:hypothetical protein